MALIERPTLRLATCGFAACIVSIGLLAGCDESAGEPDIVDPPATTAPASGSTVEGDVTDAMNAGRSSTLGQARDTAENTVNRVEEQQKRLEEAMNGDE